MEQGANREPTDGAGQTLPSVIFLQHPFQTIAGLSPIALEPGSSSLNPHCKGLSAMKNALPMAALLAALGFSAVPFTASAQAQTADAATSDEALVSSVKTALAAHPEFKADGLKITSKNAEVTLSGLVEDGPTLYKIALEVQKVPGVKYVMRP